ncbi:YajG family lipoprotein [Azospirillum argentinense]|uniref:YajG family lipoprotein n=1 Tax=Azospirillum argentinense TaxID=2970906 RepID=UPI0015865E39|nr:YajG family lipoprotein [Azospirillum argentinense]
MQSGIGALVLSAVAICLPGCGTTPTDLTYRPAAQTIAATGAIPMVEISTVTDARKNPSNKIGTVRGGYGNPFWILETKTPVNDMVRQAFIEGLKSRGLLAKTDVAYIGLVVSIERLDSNQLMRREGHTRFNVKAIDKSTGQQLYSQVYEDNRVEDGSFVSQVDGLRKIINDSMQAAIDQALDDPKLTALSVSRPQSAGAPLVTMGSSVEARLATLKDLRERNLVSQKEYEDRRRKILEDL